VHTLEIVGSVGTLRWNNADGVLALFRQDRQDWETYVPPEGFDRNSMFMDEMSDFLAAARGERQPLCGLEDGIRVLEIALAARQSAADGLRKHLSIGELSR
jgi:predicted dehydrogenase